MSQIDQIQTVTDPVEMRQLVKHFQSQGKRVGVVLTMGALHAGHLSLVKASTQKTDLTVATIFVNPTQFAPNEDLSKYPRPLERDLDLLRDAGVTHVFIPTAETMYPDNASTEITPPKIAKKLEGEFRPTHFSGVTTVVLKLLNIVGADAAFFGQKDFQQAAVIKQMVRDLFVPVEIFIEPIVRDDDGLALSSRNIFLSSEERKIALSLNRTLKHVEKLVQSGLTDSYELVTEMRQMLIDANVTSIDYAIVANPKTLEIEDPLPNPAVAMIAAHVGTTRLIDNVLIEKK